MTWTISVDAADLPRRPAGDIVDEQFATHLFADDAHRDVYREDAIKALIFAEELPLTGNIVICGWRSPRYDDPTKTALGISVNCANIVDPAAAEATADGVAV